MSNCLRPRMGLVGAITALTLLAGAGALTTTPALAAPGEGCPNEQVRQESNTNPATGQPYSVGLPECRAYEMVSPLEKQQHDAINPVAAEGFPVVSPSGSVVGWDSQGNYADPENTDTPNTPSNPYVAQRSPAGWITTSVLAPASLIEAPGDVFAGPNGVLLSPDLLAEAGCGLATLYGSYGTNLACALRASEGEWMRTPAYPTLSGQGMEVPFLLGASSDLSDVVVRLQYPGAQLLDSDAQPPCSFDTQDTEGCEGLYEIAGLGTASPELRLVDVADNGEKIGPESVTSLGSAIPGTNAGTNYQAVSADGSKIYFTATPVGGVPTVYARIDGTETVAVSESLPAQCSGACAEAPRQEASYSGASADGAKVFFTSAEPLVNADTDETTDLYEYDFAKPPAERMIQISGGGEGDLTPGSGAGVAGVVSVSEDGSHVYFIAEGVLTTLPNGVGQTATPGAANLYGYDTDTGETKFVGTLSAEDVTELTGGCDKAGSQLLLCERKLAQSTPDGNVLVFNTSAKLIAAGAEADTSGAEQVYRYDFHTGDLFRVSISHDRFGDNGNMPGMEATIAPVNDTGGGAFPTVNDSNRAVSENGEEIVFATAEQLQAGDISGASNQSCRLGSSSGEAGCEIYLWHECAGSACADGEHGEVNMISDGVDPAGAGHQAISASGDDIFFETDERLVGQDTDELGDIYDARIDGGFPAPTPEPSCSGESCRGVPPAAPSFAAPGSQGFTAGGNLSPGSTAFPAPVEAKPKPLTKAHELAKALKQCRRDKSKKNRESCEKSAHKRYSPPKKKSKKIG